MPHEQPIADMREDTMIYREPTTDSDENAVQDIWGRQLEVMTVDASEVQGFLSAGWVQHPLDLGKKPEEIEGFKREPRAADKELAETRLALETAEKMLGEKTKAMENLVASNLELQAQRDKAQNDQKAAEELADAESKAKDAALAELQALKDKQVKTTGKG